jgi:hypothetical protein
MPRIGIALFAIGAQWLFVILFVAIGFGIHTHPPNEYYASPIPVKHISHRCTAALILILLLVS